MRELNLKYTIVPGKSTVLVRFTIDSQVSFTMIIETRGQWVSLKMQLIGSRNISALTRNELATRLLTANTRLNMTSFGLDQFGNVGVACDLPLEDFTPSCLSRHVRSMINAMLHFHNEIGRPLGIRYGEPVTIRPAAAASSAPSISPSVESFEVEICDIVHGRATRFIITKATTAREILLQATKELNLSGDYYLVHNSRKLEGDESLQTADRLLIRPGDALDIIPSR